MVMQTFVDAFPHIPEHRRLPLFTHLVQSVGGMEYLWRVILLLIGGYATKGATAMLPEETETKVGLGYLFTAFFVLPEACQIS